MTQDCLEIRRVGPVRFIVLNRPEKSNAYNDLMLQRLHAELQDAEASAQAIVLTGAGARAFCGGADFDELRAHRAATALDLPSRNLFDRIAASPLPVVAALNGAAIGGGLELALACDLRVAHPNARFALPETELGLVPAAGALRRLPAVIGGGRARDVILFGRALDSATALDWGLVTHVGDDFLAHATDLASRAARRDPLATAVAKRILHGLETRDVTPEATGQAMLYERKADS